MKVEAKNRNPGKELNFKQYKTLFKSLKKESMKNCYIIQILLIHANIIHKKPLGVMKEISENIRVNKLPFPSFITVKNINIRQKRNCGNVE